MTNATHPSGLDEMTQYLRDEIILLVSNLLQRNRSAGLRLQIPNTDTFIFAGTEAWIARQMGDVPPVPERLTGEEIDIIWQTMPGGPAAWLKGFGYLNFARAIEDEVHLAIGRAPLPAPAQVEVAGWISVEDRLPACSKKAGSLGVEVIVYPQPEKGESTAFFGCRLTDEPDFYKYGARVYGVTHWMPLPAAPTTTKEQA